jgi:hypothetical protein
MKQKRMKFKLTVRNGAVLTSPPVAGSAPDAVRGFSGPLWCPPPLDFDAIFATAISAPAWGKRLRIRSTPRKGQNAPRQPRGGSRVGLTRLFDVPILRLKKVENSC